MSRTFTIYGKLKRPKIEPVHYQETWVDYEYVDVKESTGSGENDFEIKTKEVAHETNINEHIESFASEVGVRNIMAKIAMTKDLSLAEQVPAEYADLSVIPDTPQEKLAAMKTAEEAYSAIDPELRGNLSMEDFIKSLDEQKISKYIDAKIAAAEAKKGAKE